MRVLGNKVARAQSRGRRRRGGDAGDRRRCRRTWPSARAWPRQVGYPVMLKASWGGGGRGMRVVESDAQLAEAAAGRAARGAAPPSATTRCTWRSWCAARATSRCRSWATATATWCTCSSATARVQRRNQKVVERAPAVFLSDAQRAELCAAALAIGRAAHYCNAGTVEFLQDADSGQLLLHRGQSAHPGRAHGHRVRHRHRPGQGADPHRRRRAHRHARERRAAAGRDPHRLRTRCSAAITTEDPENNFIPDYGRITAYRSPAGFGIRLDAGTAYTGAIITRSYDSLLVKVTAWAPTPEETIARMHRALWEFRIRGVATNLRFLDQLITHPRFARGDYTTRFIDETPELFRWPRKRDRATRILDLHRPRPSSTATPRPRGRAAPGAAARRRGCRRCALAAPPPGTQAEARRARAGALRAMDAARRSACCSPTPPCAMRTSRCSRRACARIDMVAIAPVLRERCCRSCSRWNAGAGRPSTWRCASCSEDPWERLAQLREAMPNLLLQMLLRVGQCGRLHQLSRQRGALLRRAAPPQRGIDVFRIFDSLNWVENMRVADRRGARDRQAVRGGDLLHAAT